MATAQVPPAVGTSGQLIDVITINAGSTIFREVVAIGGHTSSGIAVVTTSGGLTVNVSSGVVMLSSVHTVTATAATNPWSSAPGFNVPIVSASSGLVQISGTATVLATAGTNPWSSAPTFSIPVVSASSGVIQVAGPVASTVATNPWSSAPSFPIPVASASSGVVQISPQSSDALLTFGYVSSSSANSNLIVAIPAAFFGYSYFNTTGSLRFLHLYHTSSAPGIGTTANWVQTFMIPYSTAGGAGANLVSPVPLSYTTKGLGFTITNGINSTSTGSVGNNDIALSIYYKT